MNEEQEEQDSKEEEFKIESFDDFITSLEKEKTPLEELETAELDLKKVKDSIIYILKQLKASNEQIDFLTAFQEKYDLKNFVVKANETFDRFLVDLAILQEQEFEKIQELKTQFKKEPFLPKTFSFIFLKTEEFEKKFLQKKQRKDWHELLRETKNTELSVPDDILEIDRNKKLFRDEIKFIKEQLTKRDLRLKKVKKVAPNLKDVTVRIEGERIVDISMLIYYYYKLSNEDVETDKGLAKVFPEIEEAQKEIEKLEKELKKNLQNDSNGKTDQKTSPKKATDKETEKKEIKKV